MASPVGNRKADHNRLLEMLQAALQSEDFRAIRAEWLFQAADWCPRLLTDAQKDFVAKCRKEARATKRRRT